MLLLSSDLSQIIAQIDHLNLGISRIWALITDKLCDIAANKRLIKFKSALLSK